jgi:hypothetical protein
VSRLLRTTDVQKITGWSPQKIRRLIEIGKLKAFDSSTTKRPFWNIVPESLDEMLSGSHQPKAVDANTKRTSKKRIDADVPKVFGGDK